MARLADANSANGFSSAARSAPRRCAYIPSRPPHSASKLGCTLAIDAPRAESGGLLGIDHLDVLESVPAAGHRRHPVTIDDTFERIDNRTDRGVADDVEARRHPRLGAGRAGAR